MVNSVLMSIPVYWCSLFILPSTVVNKIKSYIFHFLWGKILIITSFISLHGILYRSQRLWGVGVLNNWALSTLLFARKVCGDVLQTMDCGGLLFKARYLKRLPMVYWFRSRHQNLTNGSLLWRGLIKSYPIINQYICWLPSRGTHIFLGTDAIIGLSEGYKLTK